MFNISPIIPQPFSCFWDFWDCVFVILNIIQSVVFSWLIAHNFSVDIFFVLHVLPKGLQLNIFCIVLIFFRVVLNTRFSWYILWSSSWMINFLFQSYFFSFIIFVSLARRPVFSETVMTLAFGLYIKMGTKIGNKHLF